MIGKVLIIEDDTVQQELLGALLRSVSLEAQFATTAHEATALLEAERFHAVLLDLVLLDGTGMDVLRFVRSHEIKTPVIVVSGHGDWTVVRECLDAGALDFVSKPYTRLELLAVLHRALLRSGLLVDKAVPEPKQVPLPHFPFLIGRSGAMRDVLSQIAKVAQTDANVCVYGESGTGKELVARAIHYSSARAGRPLIVFDCAAVPEGLMESELFGHVKGAFTSAVADREGAFQLADGGSLFLDEVGELSLPLQAKLLRVIQSREFRKVGGNQPMKVDVRILCATNRDLSAMVARNKFRVDLFYRLEVIPITIPPLRERKEDVPLLVDHFVQKFNRNNKKRIRSISSRTMGALLRYHCPGNVRELENTVERAAVMSDGPTVDLEDLSKVLRSTLAPPELPRLHSQAAHSLREAEQQHIVRVLQDANGNRTSAAKVLGISLRTLHYRLKGIHPDALPPAPRGNGKKSA